MQKILLLHIYVEKMQINLKTASNATTVVVVLFHLWKFYGNFCVLLLLLFSSIFILALYA